MISLAMVVDREFRKRPSQAGLSEEHEPIEAFLFDRANEALRMRVAVRRAVRYVTSPWTVHASEVKKSAATIAPQCAAKNVRHDIGR